MSETTTTDKATTATENTRVKRTVLASVIGTVAEYYDFFIYGTASALVFNKIFSQTSTR